MKTSRTYSDILTDNQLRAWDLAYNVGNKANKTKAQSRVLWIESAREIAESFNWNSSPIAIIRIWAEDVNSSLNSASFDRGAAIVRLAEAMAMAEEVA